MDLTYTKKIDTMKRSFQGTPRSINPRLLTVRKGIYIASQITR
jgi:hypothetical protein